MDCTALEPEPRAPASGGAHLADAEEPPRSRVANALVNLPSVDARTKANLDFWGQKKCAFFLTRATGTELRILLRHTSKQPSKNAKYALATALVKVLRKSGVAAPSPERRNAAWIRIVSEQEFKQMLGETQAPSASPGPLPAEPEPVLDVVAGDGRGASLQPVPHAALSGQEETSSLELVEEAVADPLAQLTDADVSRVRKTTESPPRVSIYDVMERVLGIAQARKAWLDLKASHPEVVTLSNDFKFDGQGQRETPVADARGIVRIIMLLPCRAAAPVRAKVCERLLDYLGSSQDVLLATLEGQTRASLQPVPHAALSGQEETSSLELVEEAVADPLAQFTDADVSQIRKTPTAPPCVSVFDAIGVMMQRVDPKTAWRDLQRRHREVGQLVHVFKFPGQGQRETPVADARGIVRIIMLLPCRAAAPVRAKVCERLLDYLGSSHDILHAALAGGERESTPTLPALTGETDVLSQLTDTSVLQIRKTDDSPPRVSVIDTIRSFTGVQQPDWTWRQLKNAHPEVHGLTTDFKFEGQGQKKTPVADARGIVRIIMLLPCRAAAPVRAKAADVLVRYLGGDPSLVPEIAQNRAAQEMLPESHPARIFGETVEHESRVPPPPQEFHEAPQLEGAAHLYALGSQAHPRLFKTGSGKDPWERLRSENRKHNGKLRLYIAAVWYNEAHLEHFARSFLFEMPPDELAVEGTEYRMTSLREIQDATDAARLRYKALTRPHVRNPDEEVEAECKRRRLCLQVAREEFELEKARRSYSLEMAQREFALEEQKFDLEKRRNLYDRSDCNRDR